MFEDKQIIDIVDSAGKVITTREYRWYVSVDASERWLRARETKKCSFKATYTNENRLMARDTDDENENVQCETHGKGSWQDVYPASVG